MERSSIPGLHATERTWGAQGPGVCVLCVCVSGCVAGDSGRLCEPSLETAGCAPREGTLLHPPATQPPKRGVPSKAPHQWSRRAGKGPAARRGRGAAAPPPAPPPSPNRKPGGAAGVSPGADKCGPGSDRPPRALRPGAPLCAPVRPGAPWCALVRLGAPWCVPRPHSPPHRTAPAWGSDLLCSAPLGPARSAPPSLPEVGLAGPQLLPGDRGAESGAPPALAALPPPGTKETKPARLRASPHARSPAARTPHAFAFQALGLRGLRPAPRRSPRQRGSCHPRAHHLARHCTAPRARDARFRAPSGLDRIG